MQDWAIMPLEFWVQVRNKNAHICVCAVKVFSEEVFALSLGRRPHLDEECTIRTYAAYCYGASILAETVIRIEAPITAKVCPSATFKPYA